MIIHLMIGCDGSFPGADSSSVWVVWRDIFVCILSVFSGQKFIMYYTRIPVGSAMVINNLLKV